MSSRPNNPEETAGSTPAGEAGGGGGGAGAGRGAGGAGRALGARLVNSQEVALTVLFLIVLTMILLYGITMRWPVCELPEDANAAAAAGAQTNANAPSNANAPANTNANTNTAAGVNANANTNANANANTNANANANANANLNANTAPQGQPVQSLPGQSPVSPIIRSVEPASGDIRGNKLVTIKGTGLGSDVVVRFDQVPARRGSAGSDSMTVWTPRHEEGAVDVTVERGALKDTLVSGYTYVCPAPTGTNLFLMLIMAGALGGCVHALRSLFWYVGNEELRLSWLPMYYILPFSGAAMAMLFSLLIVAGIVDNTTGRNTSLFIIALAGLVGMFSQQAALKLTDIANATFTKPGPGKDSRPQESQSVGAGTPLRPTTLDARITPNFGPPSGGTPVVITNTGFTDVRSVTFGGVEATDVAYNKANSSITAVTPEHDPGEVEVIVANTAGKTFKLRYTYTPPVTGGGGATAAAPKVDPPAGPAAGGQTVTITGVGLADVSQVLFGGTPSATAPTISADKSVITATTPPHTAGEVEVEVRSSAGEVKTLTYRYE